MPRRNPNQKRRASAEAGRRASAAAGVAPPDRAARDARRAEREARDDAAKAELERRLRRHALAFGRDELIRRCQARGMDTSLVERPMPPGFSIGWTPEQLAEHQLYVAPRDECFRPLLGSLPDSHPAKRLERAASAGAERGDGLDGPR